MLFSTPNVYFTYLCIFKSTILETAIQKKERFDKLLAPDLLRTDCLNILFKT